MSCIPYKRSSWLAIGSNSTTPALPRSPDPSSSSSTPCKHPLTTPRAPSGSTSGYLVVTGTYLRQPTLRDGEFNLRAKAWQAANGKCAWSVRTEDDVVQGVGVGQAASRQRGGGVEQDEPASGSITREPVAPLSLLQDLRIVFPGGDTSAVLPVKAAVVAYRSDLGNVSDERNRRRGADVAEEEEDDDNDDDDDTGRSLSLSPRSSRSWQPARVYGVHYLVVGLHVAIYERLVAAVCQLDARLWTDLSDVLEVDASYYWLEVNLPSWRPGGWNPCQVSHCPSSAGTTTRHISHLLLESRSSVAIDLELRCQLRRCVEGTRPFKVVLTFERARYVGVSDARPRRGMRRLS